MKALFDTVSFSCSKRVTSAYSTSFSHAVKMLHPSIQLPIHSIYGFVRFADEIVDSFHDYDKAALLDKFEADLNDALDQGISLNPILNAFQHTVKQYNIDKHLIDSFLESMKMDLEKDVYMTHDEYKSYIYGSADVVGLMCLKVFVNGNDNLYNELKETAMRLGSAFQKVNFLRDIKDDVYDLNRSYFPHVNLRALDPTSKQEIIAEIEEDFEVAYTGIIQLPKEARFGVYTAYVYYKRLLVKLKRTPSSEIMNTRIRVKNHVKMGLLAKSYISNKLNLI